MNETVPADKIDKSLLNRPEHLARNLGPTGVPERRFIDMPPKCGCVNVDKASVTAPKVFDNGENK